MGNDERNGRRVEEKGKGINGKGINGGGRRGDIENKKNKGEGLGIILFILQGKSDADVMVTSFLSFVLPLEH